MSGRRLRRSLCAAALVLLGWQAGAAAQWQVLESEHFLIAFTANGEPIARQVAYYAEQASAEIGARLDHTPAEKTRIVLVDLGDVPNGFSASPFGYNIEQYFLTYAGPNDPLRTPIANTFNGLLAVHEHTHTLQHDSARGLAGVLKAVFGKIGRFEFTPIPPLLQPDLTAPSNSIPISLVEGLAVFVESLAPGGGRLHDPLWEMFLRADVAGDRLMSFAQASGNYRYSRPVGDAPTYLYGATFLDYIARTYGEDRVFEIVQEISRRDGRAYDAAFRAVLDRSARAVWAEFSDELRATYAAQADALRAEGLEEGEPLTRHGGQSAAPAFSPDGATLGYVQGGNGLAGAVRLMDANGRRNRTAAATNTVTTHEGFAWSPDGRRLVYGKLDWVSQQLVSDLYVTDLDAGRERRLTVGVRANAPTWSPDGQTIAFVAKTAPLESSLMAMDADGGNVRVLVRGTDEMQFNSPRFSPDGRALAVGVFRFGGFDDVFLYDLASGELRPLTSDRAGDYAPAWTPDGAYVLFNSDRSGVHNVYAYRLADGRLFQVTRALYGAFWPAPSPDGRQLAYVGYGPEGYDVFAMAIDPGRWRPVALSFETPPAPPDFAGLTQDLAVHAYSPLATLLPHSWQPVLFPGLRNAVGLYTASADLLGHTSYRVLGEFDLDRQALSGSLFVEQTFGGLANEQLVAGMLGGPLVPSVSVGLTPGAQTVGGRLVLQASTAVSQVLQFEAGFGQLGVAPGPPPRPVRGLSLDGGWTLTLSGGRDRIQTQHQLSLSVAQRFSDFGDATTLSGSWTSALVYDDDLSLSGHLSVALGPAGAGGWSALGAAGVDTTLFYLEGLLFGDWPVYLERFRLGLVFSTVLSGQGTAAQVQLRLTLPTYFWYRYAVDFSLSVACPLGAGGLDVTRCQPGF